MGHRPRIVLRRNTFGSMKPVVAQWDSRSPRGRFGAPPGRLYALTFKHFEDLLIGDAPTFAQVADLGYGCV